MIYGSKLAEALALVWTTQIKVYRLCQNDKKTWNTDMLKIGRSVKINVVDETDLLSTN